MCIRDRLEVVTEGGFYYKNGTYFLLFSEYQEIGKVSVIVRARADVVSIKRSGVCSARMEYEKGTHKEVLYSLPYGDIVIDLETDEVINLLTDDGGSLQLKYKLIVNGEEFYNDMTIDVSVD